MVKYVVNAWTHPKNKQRIEDALGDNYLRAITGLSGRTIIFTHEEMTEEQMKEVKAIIFEPQIIKEE